jgi:hypothetical protein
MDGERETARDTSDRIAIYLGLKIWGSPKRELSPSSSPASASKKKRPRYESPFPTSQAPMTPLSLSALYNVPMGNMFTPVQVGFAPSTTPQSTDFEQVMNALLKSPEFRKILAKKDHN